MAISIQDMWEHMVDTGNTPRTATELVLELGSTLVEVETVLQAGLASPNVAFINNGALWEADPFYEPATPTLADRDALAALQSVVCAPPTVLNEVNVVLAANSWSKFAWSRHLQNTQDLVDTLRCPELRARILATGLSPHKLDAFLNSAEMSVTIGKKMRERADAASV